jgi:hypothetical protein
MQTNEQPKTVWRGQWEGRHPCKKVDGRIPQAVWLELVKKAPGSTRAELEAMHSVAVKPNLANHCLSKLEKKRLVRSERVTRPVGNSGYFQMKIWFPVEQENANADR